MFYQFVCSSSKTKRKKGFASQFWMWEMSNYQCVLFTSLLFSSKFWCLLKINKIKTKLFVKTESGYRGLIHANTEIGFIFLVVIEILCCFKRISLLSKHIWSFIYRLGVCQANRLVSSEFRSRRENNDDCENQNLEFAMDWISCVCFKCRNDKQKWNEE